MKPTEIHALLRSDRPRDQQSLLQALRQAAHRALRRERASSLQTADLANEVYLRLVGGQALEVHDQAHLRRLLARVARHVLVDRARERRAAKRGGAAVRITYTERRLADDGLELDVLALHEALDQLGELDARVAQIVEMRVFGGCSAADLATALGVSRATVQSEWAFALTWLRKQLADG